MSRKSTGYYAAWIASNGRSSFKKPRSLYQSGWSENKDEGWDKGGNHSASIDEEGFEQCEYGGFTYVSMSEGEVALVIETARQVFSGLLRSWGVRDK